MLAMTTDYAEAVGNPQEALRKISQAGFAAVHWCHHWNTDFLYDKAELDAIERWMNEYDLVMGDLHASAGVEKNWGSAVEHERLAGVELVKNRIDMAERFDCDAIIMHLPPEMYEKENHDLHFENFCNSLDVLEPYAMSRHVRIALENMPWDNFDLLEECFNRYGGDFLGLCYDAGHGNITGNGLDRLSDNLKRLIALHLHDNDGCVDVADQCRNDLHRNLFHGTTDWSRLAELIAKSELSREYLTLEVLVHHEAFEGVEEFMAAVKDAGDRFAGMVGES